jgi:hypothetical protein
MTLDVVDVYIYNDESGLPAVLHMLNLWSIPFMIRSWSVFGAIGTGPVIRELAFLVELIRPRRCWSSVAC